jgi:prevent-host-death family protein
MMTNSPPPKRVVREAIGLYEAKTQLSALVERAAAGEEIIIMKSGQPMARLVPMENTRAQRVPGRGRGEWRVSADFDAALEPDVLADFEGR